MQCYILVFDIAQLSRLTLTSKQGKNLRPLSSKRSKSRGLSDSQFEVSRPG